MDTALPLKFPFILDRNLAKAICTENRVCTSCDTVVLGTEQFHDYKFSVQNNSTTINYMYRTTSRLQIFCTEQLHDLIGNIVMSYRLNALICS